MTPFTFEMIKKYSIYFLGPDPRYGQHSGKAREYDFNNGFKIYLGADLVTFLNYSVNEAQQILTDVYPWLESKGWTPMENSEFRETHGKITQTPPFWKFYNNFPDLTLFVSGEDDKFGYIIREVLPPDYENIEDLEFVKAENWAEIWHEEDRDPFRIHGWDHPFGDQGEYVKHVPHQLHLWSIVNRLGAGWSHIASGVAVG